MLQRAQGVVNLTNMDINVAWSADLPPFAAYAVAMLAGARAQFTPRTGAGASLPTLRLEDGWVGAVAQPLAFAGP